MPPASLAVTTCPRVTEWVSSSRSVPCSRSLQRLSSPSTTARNVSTRATTEVKSTRTRTASRSSMYPEPKRASPRLYRSALNQPHSPRPFIMPRLSMCRGCGRQKTVT